MCGIVAYVGKNEASPIVLSALRRLEYRGYDSAGIAGLRERSKSSKGFDIRRCEGSLDQLENLLERKPIHGHMAIGHTRWATHGRPSEQNAHPHRHKDVVIVHNGIIENYRDLKDELSKKGHRFESETDSEVIAHLLQRYIDQTNNFEESCRMLVKKLKGAFATAAMWVKEPELLFVAKQHCPILLGTGDGENFVASDIPALLEFTKNFLILNDHEMAFVDAKSIRIMDFSGNLLQRKPKKVSWTLAAAEKEGFDHFMLKEIHEQSRVVQDTLRGRILAGFEGVEFDGVKFKKEKWKSFEHLQLLGCGSAWHAGLVGSFWLEKIGGVHTQVDLGSEFRYRDPILNKKTLGVAISQSGETADTLAALTEAKKNKASLLAVTNTVDSSIARTAKNVVYTLAGPEISVASTKCFTAQLAVMALLSAKVALVKRSKKKDWIKKYLKDLSHLPQHIDQVIGLNDQIKKIAEKYKSFEQYFYLGRGMNYPIALEGALKLKEIAYINTQAYPAGEMKHGPIALINENWPVVCLAPDDSVLTKIQSNMEEVKARGGRLIVVGTEGNQELQDIADEWIGIPKVREELNPFLTNICLQLFAYHMAVLLGHNVDKPRNLAKSVTVE